MKVFKAYVNGYSFTATDINELQAWIDDRKRDCKGHTLKIWKGIRHGTADCFTIGPVADREAVL